MINIEDLPKRVSETVKIESSMNADDSAALQFLDAEMEGIATQLTGDMFAVTFDTARFPHRVIAALKMTWEAGGWIVGAMPVNDNAMQVVFVRPRNSTRAVTQHKREVKTEDVVPATKTSTRTPKMSTSLLLRMPTRGRPMQALDVLSEYRRLATTHVKMEVVVDEDDTSMHEATVLQRLYDLDCSVCVGWHANKIAAVNGGLIDDWAILVLASDDMVPAVSGWDVRIVAAMDEHFPLRDGAVYFNDGYNKDHQIVGESILCTLPILGRHLYDQFGYVYESGYKSLFSDTEQTAVLTKMHRLVFVDELIIEHRHHAAGKAPFDALYQFNDGTYGAADRKLFGERQARGFDMPELTLSVLVCSTPERANNLRQLEEHLRVQMRRWPRRVELLVEVDSGELTVGAKRQRLLERAAGKYVAFVDDDDLVAWNYVDRILRAVEVQSDADCCSLVGVMTTDGASPQEFRHSIEYDGWYTRDGVHYRTPNHLSAVKRSLALQVGFVAKDVGEDHDYSQRLRPLLKTEASTGNEPLYYYWFSKRQSIQSVQSRGRESTCIGGCGATKYELISNGHRAGCRFK